MKQALRKSNKKLKGMKEAKCQKRKTKKESKIKKTIPQKLNKDPYVAGAIHHRSRSFTQIHPKKT